MKKFLVVLSIIFIIGLISIFIINNNNETQNEPKISTELKDNGIVDGKENSFSALKIKVKKMLNCSFFLSWNTITP
ncbi:hypothetical protein M670_03699 [Schinkia azotoformans MEV2011]|uniref:Uncharacterized protein n=1 Tax=Schinkia azotoformans MEV2011 TaxID=1348973 RepID=A0A072NI11_SCHAZ|nr:hypothetical protein [Schinkia azotoformans]KEF37106.1 hypothetical protein M670_03699 [Schinkia azotoformans MEV2011]MEC1694327.1 hypothetical protein [Schinkia azotoformans]MEC1723390.1 hypothetical protein [Schinkia azotoformans]MEC1782020.1 hypothetical protein [Schinkia azotoformans]MED4329069.1 hypothetical protein [Schinkia azotoformans]